MFFRILCIAISNLALGYGLAWYLHGPRGLFAWPKFRWLHRWRPAATSAGQVEEPLSPLIPTKLPAGAIAEEIKRIPARSTAEPSLVQVIQIVPSLPDKLDTEMGLAKFLPLPASADDVDYDLVARAVANLRDELTRYRADIATLDNRLRDCVLAPDEKVIRECAENFHRVNSLHLETRGPQLKQIEANAVAGVVYGIAVELAEAVDRQSAIIESAQAELAHFGPETELLAQCQQMLDETQQISQTARQLDATIDETLSEINRTKPALASNPLERSTLGQLQQHSLNLEPIAHDTRD